MINYYYLNILQIQNSCTAFVFYHSLFCQWFPLLSFFGIFFIPFTQIRNHTLILSLKYPFAPYSLQRIVAVLFKALTLGQMGGSVNCWDSWF